MKRTELRLPDELHEHYRKKAFEAKTSLNQEIVKALENQREKEHGMKTQLAANIFTAKFVAYDEQGEPHFFHTEPEAKKHCKHHDRRYFQWDTKEQKPRAVWSDATARWEGISSH